MPHYFKNPPKPKAEVYPLHLEKFLDIVSKSYVVPRPATLSRGSGFIKSLFDVFDVKKPGDIRMVYDQHGVDSSQSRYLDG